MEDTLKKVAKEHLGVVHWETRGLDRLDFHDVSVGSIRKALEAAYKAGHNEGYNEGYEEGDQEGYDRGCEIYEDCD